MSIQCSLVSVGQIKLITFGTQNSFPPLYFPWKLGIVIHFVMNSRSSTRQLRLFLVLCTLQSVQKCSEILGSNIFQKIHLQETRPLIRSCMPKLDFEREHYLRSKGGYIPFKNLGSKFKTSFFPYHSELWNSLPKNIQS